MQEKLKTEGETSARLRKQVTEVTMAKVANEQLAAELRQAMPGLQAQRTKLEEEVNTLQNLLSQERTSHSHLSRRHVELEGAFFGVIGCSEVYTEYSSTAPHMRIFLQIVFSLAISN